MKYNSYGNFLDACQKEIEKDNILNKLGIRVDNTLLKELDISPDKITGHYNDANLKFLLLILRQKYQENIETAARIKNSEIFARFPFLKSTNISSVFITTFFSKEFQKELRKLRTKYKIPKEGFGKNKKGLEDWIIRVKKTIKPIKLSDSYNQNNRLSQKENINIQITFLKFIVNPSLPRFKKIKKLFLPPNIPLTRAIDKLFNKYNFNIPHLAFYQLVLAGPENMLSADSTNFGIISLHKKPNKKTVSIDIKRNIDIDYLIKIIKENQLYIKIFLEKSGLPKLPSVKKKKQNFLVYYYLSKNKSVKEIEEIMRVGHDIKLNPTSIRQIKSRFLKK